MRLVVHEHKAWHHHWDFRLEITLVRLRRSDGNQWLLIKSADEFAVRHWKIESDLTRSRLRSLRERRPPCESQ